MGLANTYSRRLRASQPDGVDVYQYDEVPDKVRVQIIIVLQELVKFLADYDSFKNSLSKFWIHICCSFARDNGIKKLCDIIPYDNDRPDKKMIFIIGNS